MAVKIRGKRDEQLDKFAEIMERLVADHPQAEVTLRRTDLGFIRVRVIDPEFRRMQEDRRDNRVWKYLKRLPDEVLNHLSMVLPFTPEEAETSPLNRDFEHPIRMRV